MTLPASYFDQMYSDDPDPWGFSSRPYEYRKRAITLACLTRARYGRVFEPGCSIGLLTADLASRSDEVVAMDLSATCLEAARLRVPDHVDLVLGALPGDWPEGTFDLVLLSEVGYYLDRRDCEEMATLAMTCAREVVAVHWRHPVEDYPLSGDDVQLILAQAAQLADMTRLVRHEEKDFVAEVWSGDGRSVGERSGLA